DQRIWELEQRLNQIAASFEDVVASRPWYAVIVQMQREFGDEYNLPEVSARMDELVVYVARMVPQVHYQIMGERYYQQKKAEMEYQAKQQAETASRVAAKEDASVVSSAGSAANVGTPPPQPTSLYEAISSAYDEVVGDR